MFRRIIRGATAGVGALVPFALAAIPAAVATAPAWAAEAARDTSGVVEEIVVTSRRRSESQQDVPVAVSAFRPEDIERIAPATLRDFDGLMPNVFIGMNTAGPSAGAIYIRGIGYADIEKTQSPAVGVVIDGVYQGSSTGQLIDAFDLQQLEVNRGPQGVLFGKNTTGGTIVANRSRPTGEWGVKVSGESGKYENDTYKLVANAPIIEDELALKVGATRHTMQGYVHNTTRGTDAGEIDYQAATVAALWTPIENFEALLTYDRIEDTGDIPPQDPRYNGDNPQETESDIQEAQKLFVNGLGLQMKFTTDMGTLTSITGWSNNDDSVRQDFDGSALTGGNIPLARLHTFRDQTYDQFSQELRFEFAINEQIDATVGGFYFDSDLEFSQGTETIVQLPNVALFQTPAPVPNCAGVFRPNPGLGDVLCQLPATFAEQRASESVESYAVFASANWRLAENFEIAAGMRYIDEKKEFSNAYFQATGPNQALETTVPGIAFNDSDSWDELIFETSATWQYTDNNNLYVRYAEGFRSGGFSIRGSGQAVCSATICSPADEGFLGVIGDVVGPSIIGPNGLEVAAPPDGLPDLRIATPSSFDPETVFSVEIGSKNDFFDRRLRINLSAFYTELDGAQFSTIIQTPTLQPSTNTIINNANTTEIKGLEAEVIAVLSDNFKIIATGGLQESESKDFKLVGLRSNRGPGSTLPGAGAVAVVPGDDFGFRTPEYNWSVTGIYEREIGAGTLTASLSYRGQDEYVIGTNAGLPIYEDGYEVLDASLSYAFTLNTGQNLRLFATGKNLTDKEYKQQILTLGSLNSGFQGWGPPLMWTAGIELEM